MLLQPAVVPGLVGVQIVKHHMNLAACVPGDQFIHKVEKLAPSASIIVARLDHPRGDLQGREQGGCSVALIAMAEAVESLSVGQPEIALHSLQRLDRRFLVDGQHQRILRWMKIETHHVGGPSTSITAGDFGRITALRQNNTPRQLQFALRLSF